MPLPSFVSSPFLDWPLPNPPLAPPPLVLINYNIKWSIEKEGGGYWTRGGLPHGFVPLSNSLFEMIFDALSSCYKQH